MSRSPSRSFLVVTASPDDRLSTVVLRDIVDDLARRDGIVVETWFLRATPEEDPWPGSKVVDELRLDPMAQALERFGVPRLPATIRGRRLAAWVRRVDPDVVLFDDRLGDRVLSTAALDRTTVVHRVNGSMPRDAVLESAGRGRADLIVTAPGAAGDAGATPSVAGRVVRDHRAARRAATTEARAATRRSLGIDADVPLVVGWGTDGWLDGPDLFVRTLWVLEHRFGLPVHGLWLDGGDEHDRGRLRTEAERCGLTGRFHLSTDGTVDPRVCGDVVLLPYRGTGDVFDVHGAIAAGLEVVSFASLGVDDPAVVVVPELDVESAGAAVAASLDGDRVARIEAATLRVEVSVWVDELLAALGAAT